MKPLRKLVTSLIGYDRRERRGTYILSVMLIAFMLVRVVAFRSGKIPEELPPLTVSENERDVGTASKNAEMSSVRLFIFDPNTASQEELQALGLSERQARTLVNYRNSGARFRRPEELGRVYGIDSATVERLIPYIHIGNDYAATGKSGTGGITPDVTVVTARGNANVHAGRGSSAEEGRGKAGNSFSSSTPASAGAGEFTDGREAAAPGPVDLNLCTAEELVSLPGIGPVLSVRIIRYRSLLGGFVESSQLKEVYGLDSSVVRMIESCITVTFDSVRLLSLDSVTFGDLARHPYLGYEAARRITRYRSITKEPLTLGGMVSSGVITPGQAERIAPYVIPSRGASGSDYEFISSKVLK
ncbi:MAG: ComEA family DNA-binding protein [Bacteroidales bacterium]